MSHISDDLLFNDTDDSVSIELKRQIAKENIERLIDGTIAKTISASGRTTERINYLNEESSSKMITIKPGGIVVRDGSETKDSFLEKLNPDEESYKEITIPEVRLNRLKKQLSTAAIGPISSVAMICTGERCQVKETCPYWKNDLAPIGELCLLETQLIREWVERYVDEFNVDVNKTTEFQLVTELAEISVYERRVNSYIAIHNPVLLQDVVSGVDGMGNPYYNTEVSRAFEVKERLKKQRMKILDAMLATRDRKAKLVVAATAASSGLAEMSATKKKFMEVIQSMKN